MNRVMEIAREKICEADPDASRIAEEIKLFMRQEGVHYRIHTAFNDMLTGQGFDELPKLEALLEKDYREFLETKSLKFLVGYCEGFEILGPIYANIWLDQIDDLFEGADRTAVAMWKWHISEEFEHRTVCFDVYHRLFGGYFYRLYTMYYAQRHQSAFILTVMDYMLSLERAAMSREEVEASKKRIKAIGRRMRRLALPYMLRIHMPWYSPRQAPKPRNYPSALSEIEGSFMRGAL